MTVESSHVEGMKETKINSSQGADDFFVDYYVRMGSVEDTNQYNLVRVLTSKRETDPLHCQESIHSDGGLHTNLETTRLPLQQLQSKEDQRHVPRDHYQSEVHVQRGDELKIGETIRNHSLEPNIMDRRENLPIPPPTNNHGHDEDSTEECTSIVQFLVRLFVCILPFIVFVAIFSAEGYGQITMAISKNHIGQTRSLIYDILLLILVFYVFDVTHWKSKICQYLAFAVIYIGIIAIAFFQQSLYPIGPLCLFTLLYPLYMLCIREVFHSSVSLKIFFLEYAQPMNIGSVLGLISWMLWCLLGYGWSLEGQENQWGETAKIRYAEELGCPANFEDYPYCRNHTLYKLTGESETCFKVSQMTYDGKKSIFNGGFGSDTRSFLDFDYDCDFYCVRVYDGCFLPFIVWANAPLLAISMGLLSFVFIFTCQPYNKVFTNHHGERPNPDSMNVNDAVKLAAKMYIVLIFVIGSCASLAGAGKGLLRAFLDFTVSSMISVVLVIFAVISEDESISRSSDETRVPLYHVPDSSVVANIDEFLEQYQPYVDALRGLALLTLLPVILLYFILSFINECVRRSGLFPFVEKYNEDDDSVLTKRVQMQIEQFCSWKDTCRIYRYALYWGIVYMVLIVIVQQYLVASLGWLIQFSQSMPLGLVLVILSVISIPLFLAPPVPTAPIFITFGILIFASGHEKLGITGCLFLCGFTSLLLRNIAWSILQMVVGKSFADNVKIRQLVGMNSPLVRGIRVVVATPGYSFSKVVIMTGAPDWPLSVLCGMLKLPLLPAMIATLPNILIIIPINLTGAFTYMASLQDDYGKLAYPWASSLSALMVLVSVITQAGNLALFGYFLEKEMKRRKDEIDQLSIDAEVAIVDQEAESAKHAYSLLTKWDSLKRWERYSLRFALLLMSSSCYIVQLFVDNCFVRNDFLHSGGESESSSANSFDIIKPLGYKALSIFTVSFLIIVSFERRSSDRIQSFLSSSGEHIN